MSEILYRGWILNRRRFLQGLASTTAVGIAAPYLKGPLADALQSLAPTSAYALPPTPSITLSPLTMVALETGAPHPDNAWVAGEFTTSQFNTTPFAANDTRYADVFSGDLGFMYDGLDGYAYGLLGDSFGSDWGGPGAAAPAHAGNSTLAAAMNGVDVSTFTGTQSITLATASFTVTGGCAVVALSSNNTLAYIRYGSRTSTTLKNCKLLFGSGTMATGDRIRGDDTWPGAGWRSNICYRSSTTDLSNGYVIDEFMNLTTGTAPGIAQQAIPGGHQGESINNVFHATSHNISTISVTSNVVTIKTANAHNLIAGQPVVVSGVANTAFNGNFTIAAVLSTTQFTYALTLANTSSTGGTIFGRANIVSIASAGFVVTVNTAVPHNLVPFQSVLVAGTGVADGQFLVYSTPSATQFIYAAIVVNGSATSGTAQPAVNINTANPGKNSEGSVIPSGAVAVETGIGMSLVGDSITSTTYSKGAGAAIKTALEGDGYTGLFDIEAVVGTRSDEMLSFVTKAVADDLNVIYVFLGTNDVIQDSVNSGAPTNIVTAQASLTNALDAADSDTVIIVTTVGRILDYFAAINGYTGPALAAQWNATLGTWAAGRPNTYVLDWDAAVQANPALVGTDGIHPSTTGKTWFATNIKALLDAHASPTFVGAGGHLKMHVAYYEDITTFGDATWYTNYMGLAYSMDAGNTWSRVGVTGTSWGTVDTSAVWANNSAWTDNFQAGWPVAAGDGYIYVMCNMAGRVGDAYMMRVLKADILTKSAYRYWNGSSWDTSATNAVKIFPDTAHSNSPVGEPCFYFHAPSSTYIAAYLDPAAGGFVLRTAPAPQGPWSSKHTFLSGTAFGYADMYGGFIHPWSNASPQSANDLYFLVSLWAPYNTYLLKATIT